MGKAGEGAEVFKNLFGGFSGSLSLFTNNPYQRSTADAAGAPAFSQPESNEKGSSKESLKKGKKLAGKEDSNNAEAEPIVYSAEKKNKKKKIENVVENDNGASDMTGKSQDVASQDVHEGAKTGKKKKRSSVADETGGSNVIMENAPSNAEPNKSAKELSSVKREIEKRLKRKVIEEEIQEEFEKNFKGSDGKKAKSEAYVQGVHSEDPEIDNILHESIQEENKVWSATHLLRV